MKRGIVLKELVGKLSRGIIEYSIPEIETSVITIEDSVEEGKTIRGSFEVFCNDEYELKGVVYSTNEYLSIVTSQFIGKRCKIEYDILAKVLEAGEILEGRINIVSNGGEAFIPFKISIIAESLPSSIGNISNLYHFVNLVKQEYDEAMRLFLSAEFKRIILKKDLKARSLYDGLIIGENKKRALEEFVIAMNKKQPVTLEISDTVREYDSLTESYGDILTLTKNTWGYQNIEVIVDGDFITDYKKNIASEDFAGNHYEFSYLININALHDGMNFGKITFQTITQKLECTISVDNIKSQDNTHIEINRCLINLTKQYLNFRMKKKGIDNWVEDSLTYIERARGFDDMNPFFKILQAQICISKKRDDEAKWLLDSVAEEILEQKENDIKLYCYYLYVRTLQKRDIEQTIVTTDVIRKYYENGYDTWELLWILLYIDTSYENNKSLKLARIKEQYKAGCHSTLMYFEALYVLNKQPGLLRVINSFELQILNFGSKYNAIDLRLAVQVSELSMLEKNFRPLLFKILTKLYETFENKVILTALLSVLIRGNRTDKKYFKWYALGVSLDIEVTRLYEYYILAMPEDFKGTIPNTVLMYYVYNGNLLYDREAFFYAIIIQNKEKQPNIYKNYRKNIERFAMQQLRIGAMNQYLAIIYGDVLTPNMITLENEKTLAKVLNTWMITCEDENIHEVIVIHKEINNERVYPIKKGIAYVQIYTEDAIVLFRDIHNNILHQSSVHNLIKLMDQKDLLEVAMERNQNDVYLMAKKCEQSLKYNKSIPKGVTLFREIMEHSSFRKEYCSEITQDIVEYYFNNYDGEELDDYLRSMDVSRLNNKTRDKVVELMIMRGVYDNIESIFDSYGTGHIDARKLLKYSSRRLKEDTSENSKMIRYCYIAFSYGKYNEQSLDYLCSYYNGTTKEMMEMWRISKEFSFESRDMEERIIAQMLFSRTNITSISTIYDSYYRKGALPLIKKAYLFFESYQYFVKENPVDDMFFRHLEDELNSSDALPDVCKCAYLLYFSKKKNISEVTKKVSKEQIAYLEDKGILFDFYKQFGKWIELSGAVLDTTTIAYRTSPQDKVTIQYSIDTGNGDDNDFKMEDMECTFQGLYRKSFTLFYGEVLKYYITEISGTQSSVAESQNYHLDDRTVEINTSRYGMLNDILVCRDLKDEETVRELADKYYTTNSLTTKLF